MWRPLEIFLYEWVPIRRRCRILAKLAKMLVVLRPNEDGQPAERTCGPDAASRRDRAVKSVDAAGTIRRL